MYGNNIVSQSGAQGGSARGWRRSFDVRPTRALYLRQNGDFLGIYTKSQATFKNTGVERLHNFLLQDQACKLLPKHRVCNCLKKRIDKTKDRLVKYNVDRKKAHWSNVQRCGCLWIDPVCAKQITEEDVQSFLLLLNVGKRNF